MSPTYRSPLGVPYSGDPIALLPEEKPRREKPAPKPELPPPHIPKSDERLAEIEGTKQELRRHTRLQHGLRAGGDDHNPNCIECRNYLYVIEKGALTTDIYAICRTMMKVRDTEDTYAVVRTILDWNKARVENR